MSHSVQPSNRLIATGILSIDTAIHSLAGAAAASVAAVQAPVGALFGGTYFVVSHLVNYGYSMIEKTSIYPLNPNGTIGKLLKLGLTVIAGIGASVLVFSLIELPLAASAVAVLGASMFGTSLLVAMFMTGSHHIKNVAIGTKFFLP